MDTHFMKSDLAELYSESALRPFFAVLYEYVIHIPTHICISTHTYAYTFLSRSLFLCYSCPSYPMTCSHLSFINSPNPKDHEPSSSVSP